MSHYINKKFWNKKRVFITGHTGFKGSWLCIILRYLNSNIYGLSLKPEKKSLFVKSNIEKELSSNYYSDINNLKKTKKFVKKCKPEIIFHLAAQPLVIDSFDNPIKTFNTNTIGTLNLLESIRKVKSVKSVVIITTDKVYEISKKNKSYKETDRLGGVDPYSSSKAAAELIVKSYVKSFFNNTHLKNKVSTVRAGNVIGGGDFSKNRLIPDIIKSLNNKTTLKVRNPNHIRPWQHVIDPLFGYLTLAEKQYKGSVNKNSFTWNFGPENKNFQKVIKIIKLIQKKRYFKYSVVKSKKIETQVLKLNSKKANKKLRWQSKWNLNQSVEKVLEWNFMVNNGISVKKVCEKQLMMYIYNK